MTDRDRRKTLAAEYKQSRPTAGIYRIVNTTTGRGLLGSTLNLAGMRNKLAFAQSTNTPSVLDQRLSTDIREHGVAALALEVLEELEPGHEQTPAQLQRELDALLELWREKLGQ